MTTESTQPQPEVGPSPANGAGQSQGHRRRRRRRKNKSNRQGAAPAQVPQVQQQAPPAPQAQAPPPRPQAPPRQNQARKKKKFFSKGSAPQQPGNSVSGMSQGKRKSKQRGPREFVGPMDHSYRAANGNVADGPASTIQISNGHGSYHPELYQPAAPVAPIRHDAPTRIFCFIDDLFFQLLENISQI